MKRLSKKHISSISGPALDEVKVAIPAAVDTTQYPFCIPLIQQLSTISFPSQVTFLVGENGTGKSTILEAIAHHAGLGPEGGSKNIAFKTNQESTPVLAEYMTLSWRNKPKDGYFFRAESFFNLANYIDDIAKFDASIYASYGGKSLHVQSHGESFLSFFANRLGNGGFFIFDEPEAALSPQRQLALMAIMHELCKTSNTQFIIATHSPILLGYPDATIYSCDGDRLTQILYTDTQHYQITKRFLDNPEQYLHQLLQ